MTEPTPPRYQDTAQVADDLIASQLKMVRDEVVRGFDRQERYNDKLDARFETMVTKTEFKAEIGRVDAQHDGLKNEVSNVEVRIMNELRKGFQEIREQGAAKVSKNRWLMGVLITLASFASGLVFQTLSAIPSK